MRSQLRREARTAAKPHVQAARAANDLDRAYAVEHPDVKAWVRRALPHEFSPMVGSAVLVAVLGRDGADSARSRALIRYDLAGRDLDVVPDAQADQHVKAAFQRLGVQQVKVAPGG